MARRRRGGLLFVVLTVLSAGLLLGMLLGFSGSPGHPVAARPPSSPRAVPSASPSASPQWPKV
ncbi:MAG: hypothetical protein ACRDOH_36600 [Streptosporangiaceae bacterium]